MPYKRKGSPYYYLNPSSVAGLTLPRRSTGLTDLKQAQRAENALAELAETGWRDLVEAYIGKELELGELTTAKMRGGEHLADLRQGLHLPALYEAIKAAKARTTDPRVLDGFEQLLEFSADPALIPPGARVGYLLTPEHVTDLYTAAIAAGRKPNSVRRSLHRAVSDLLTRHIRRGKMLAIMADVDVPSENDERNIMLSPKQARRALELADEEFRPVVGYAMTTGVDRAAMLRQHEYDYDEETGMLSVPDDKAPERKRILSLRGEPVLGNSEVWLRQLILWADTGGPLVPLNAKQIRTRWEAVRTKLGRTDVRWKDLRGIFGTYYLLAEGQPRELQRIYGHSTMAMTLRYLNNLPAGNRARLRDEARSFGLLDRPSHLHLVG